MPHQFKIGHLVPILLIILLPTYVFANPKEFMIQNIPGSVDEFVKFRDQHAKSPEGGSPSKQVLDDL